MSKIDLVSFWYSNSSIGMAPYVNTTADGGHIDYEGVSSKVDLDTRIQSIMSALPDFFSSYTIKLTDVNLGGVLVSKAECVLKTSSSESPDYTQILTDINTNLTNLNDKFISDSQYGGKLGNLIFKLVNAFAADVTSMQATQNSSYIKSLDNKLIFDNTNICKALIRIFDCINIGQVSSGQSSIKANSYIRFLTALSAFGLGSDDTGISDNSNFKNIWRTLRQSVSPNANITDVISALNTTIDSKQDTTIVNNEVTPLAEINIDVPFEVKNLKKSDVEL